MKVHLPHLRKDVVFEEASDGWFVSEEHGLAINPSQSSCIADPWYADHICEPPSYEFSVIDGDH